MFQAHRAHHQERQTVSIQPLVTVTLCHKRHRVTVTRGCIDIICLSWWCASCWSFTKNHYRMHGQQNVKSCLVVSPFVIVREKVYQVVFNIKWYCIMVLCWNIM